VLAGLFGGGMGEGLACWIFFPGLAALQSSALIGLSKLLYWRKMPQN
jgi:hypothetical protein